MLKWHKNCFVGKNVRDLERIQEKLENRRLVPGIYLLVLSENPRNIMEMFPAVTLLQRTAADLCPEIIGIALGKEEAVSLAEEIIRQVYEETGDVQVKKKKKNR